MKRLRSRLLILGLLILALTGLSWYLFIDDSQSPNTIAVTRQEPATTGYNSQSSWLEFKEWGIKVPAKLFPNSAEGLRYLFQKNTGSLVLYKSSLNQSRSALSTRQLDILEDCLNNAPRSAIVRESSEEHKDAVERGLPNYPAIKEVGGYRYLITPPQYDCTDGDDEVADLMANNVWFYSRTEVIKAIETL